MIGQEAVVRTLRNAISTGQVRQAYLFAGPRGTGKTSIARILAKALNAEGGPNADFDPESRIARSIAEGNALDVIEMDAASQRGIDDIREIRDRALLQPAEGAYKVYIIDEAHQLTDAAWNALLKLIEEPPPHLVFVFCTTDHTKVLPTVRSRCQTFAFHRPRLSDLVGALRHVADSEQIEIPNAALASIARAASGSFRDGISLLDQLSTATAKKISMQDVMQLVGTVDEDALFRLCDTVIDRDTAGAILLIEQLAEQGHDLGRFVESLLEHLRHLLYLQHVGEVSDSLPLTDDARDRLREQANQIPEPAVLRLIDLLAVAVDDQRRGGDPRLPLELALVKVTRPHADLSRESLAHRVEALEARLQGTPAPRAVAAPSGKRANAEPVEPEAAAAAPSTPTAGQAFDLEHIREAWTRSVLPALRERSIPLSALLAEATPVAFAGDALTLAFPSSAAFHRAQAEEPRNVQMLRETLNDVTGRRPTIVTTLTDAPASTGGGAVPVPELDLIEQLKSTLDATEVQEAP